MINIGRHTQSHIVKTIHQTPNQYLFSQKTTKTTTVRDRPITNIVNSKNKDIFRNSSTLYSNKRNKNFVSSLPQKKNQERKEEN